ncbi:aminotransferase class III-fold pyridoxal phosphate-dependent enzyme, partial [Bacillus pumilus]|uniref:aminotransferase class III-fold pyridoxal phosphate-dependent enzyme n=1 Tax=Bacillus pumilus TaxID=1408 RepID=UPI003C2165C9
TFGGTPIACSVALTTLEIMKEERLLDNAKVVGQYANEKLKKMKKNQPIIGEIRSVGLMIGIEMLNPKTKKPDGNAVMKI